MHVDILRPIGIGVATKDIVYGSRILSVRLPEELISFKGDVVWEFEEISVMIDDGSGIKTKHVMTVSSSIDCNWLNNNSNRMLAPDIMLGERVQIYRHADSEDYYWEALDLDNHLRSTEHLLLAFSNTNVEDRKNKQLTRENCYILEVDTKGKKIGIHTNKNDKEPFAYDFELNTKDGNFTFKDDDGQRIFVDSANQVIDMVNRDKTHYRMDKKDILEECKGNHTTKVGGDKITEVGGKETITITGDQIIKTANTKLTTGKLNVTSDDNLFTTPTTTFTGIVAMASMIAGPGSAAGSAGGPATASITGDVEVKGSVAVTVAITAPKATFDTMEAKTVLGKVGSFSSCVNAPNQLH